MLCINFLVRVMRKFRIGMTTRHLGIRVQEHLHHKTLKFPIKDHIDSFDTCKVKNLDINSFKVIRSCNTKYETKIQEALLIKKHNPQLNMQVYANGSSFFYVFTSNLLRCFCLRVFFVLFLVCYPDNYVLVTSPIRTIVSCNRLTR